MSKKSPKAYINPKMLIWARETSGLSLHDVEVRFKRIAEWEDESENPSIRQAEQLAKLYKRPLSAFYLPKPPAEPAIPPDFRTLPFDIPHKSYSQKTLLAIRRAIRLQKLYQNLYGEFHGKKPTAKIKPTDLSENPEQLAQKTRKDIDISVDTQIDWRDSYTALNQWRSIIGEMGILISTIGIPIKEGRGFSINTKVPIIVLNSKDSANGRIFSLFHELAHLMLKKGTKEETLVKNLNETEVFCNHFAGAFLVPEGNLKSLINKNKNYELDRLLGFLGNKFKVSQQVILRRMLIFKIINQKTFNQKFAELQKHVSESKGGPIEQYKKCINENGRPFISLVLNSYREKIISYADISDFLNIKLKHIPKLEKSLSQ